MSYKVTKPWVPLERIEDFVQLEPAVVTLLLALGAWFIYKIFLRRISHERNRSLVQLFSNLIYHLILGTCLFGIYWILQHLPESTDRATERITTYVGLGVIFSGATVFVKTCRILVFEYLYLSHRKVAFPLLLVNLSTLLLSLIIAAWIGAEIFNIQLTPILATSAIFSLVLGLALQDTLGNLFSGVALQVDKAYEIGDWIEVQNGSQRWVGQVFEISWRATVLIAFGEEIITIPNRVMGQAQIANFATKFRPISRILVIRLPYQVDIPKTMELFKEALNGVPEIRKHPIPNVFLHDTNESGISFKLLYYIDNYGEQFIIADKILNRAFAAFKKAGYEFASHRITLTHANSKDEISLN